MLWEMSTRTPDDHLAARRLFLQGNTIPEIRELLGIPVRTLYDWRDAEMWEARFAEEMCIASAQRRWMCLCERDTKSEADYREMEFLVGQLDKLVLVAAKQARLKASPEAVASEQKGGDSQKKKRSEKRNDFRKIGTDWLDKFLGWMKGYQRDLWEHRRERCRDILKARQTGLTMYFAREAFADALLTGDNQIFISASRAQADVFREYIKEAAREWFGIEVVGKDRMVIETPHGTATLYFLSTNSTTAQSYHGHVYIDEAFWIPKFGRLNKVASAMASQKKWRKTYFSTPSARSHEMYPFWSGDTFNASRKATGRPLVKFPTMAELSARGQRCADGQWRKVITIVDAMAQGCDFFDLEQLKLEYSEGEFNQLFMCQFIDDTAGVFKLAQLELCMEDASTWRDVDHERTPPYAGPVWLGYDPARYGDGAEVVVLATPSSLRGAFRVIEKLKMRGTPWPQQADMIKELWTQYRVEYIGIDTTGQGSGVFEMVQKFYPAVTGIYYTLESKTRLVLKAQSVINDKRLQWDAGASDIAAAFLQIKRGLTASGSKMTFYADRDEATGHADAAWAIMHALMHEGLVAPEDAQQTTLVMQD